MDVFALRERLVEEFGSYVRSFIQIADERIRELVDSALREGLLWPEPLIQLNPAFESGGSIDELVAEGLLHEECRRSFRLDKDADATGRPLRLHRHQAEAIRIARSGANYVLTTGTGSGKSLAYIIPIVDHVLRVGSGPSIKAIVVYPMNALANSQLGELEKFLCLGYPDGHGPVSFARYTGQENDERKQEIIANPPDILLTNYVMLELLLTRPEEGPLVRSARGLQFLVLDELHTYRGRQGADVAMLVRRGREAFEAPHLQCVGTSATMASGGSLEEQRREVARVSSRLFGDEVSPEHVIGETLQRITPDRSLDDPAFVAELHERVVDADHRPPHEFERFVADPLSIFIESTCGLQSDSETGRLVRVPPRSISGEEGVAAELALRTGLPPTRCAEAIAQQLLASYGSEGNPATGFPVFAFRLHQFIGRGDTVYASIEEESCRHLTVHGQRFVPGSRTKALLPLVFCRECGQEYYCVRETADPETGGRCFEPRELSDRGGGEDNEAGFLYINTKEPWPEQAEDLLERLPEDWIEETRRGPRVRRDRRDRLPRLLRVEADGSQRETGFSCHYFRAPFLFCLSCGVAYGARQRSDFGKLTALGTEGRSTATTILTLAAIRQLRADPNLEPRARKILSFTDNRQDASLQAGHFNDFVDVGLLRSALYRAVAAAGSEGLRHDSLVQGVFQAFDLPLELYASDPDVRYAALEDTKRAFRSVLAYRLYRDLERGWRVTSPNLEQCGLLEIQYESLQELCENDADWAGRHPVLENASPAERFDVAKTLLDLMRRELALKVDVLQPETQERIVQRSSQRLRSPWAIDEGEIGAMERARILYPRSRTRGDYGGHLYLSSRSGFAQYLGRSSTFAERCERLRLEDKGRICRDLLEALRIAGIVELVEEARRGKGDGVPGYQLVASAMLWKAGDGSRPFHDPIRVPRASDRGGQTNAFFIDYYRCIAEDGKGLEAREHTAQVPAPERERREEQFREAKLPILYCSPTMELGVDIAELNAVNLRNIPPTPANYAQRSGRAGRSGQPAIVFSYCTNLSPHDQYFFRRPKEMVAGAVVPPRIDLANEDLIRAHVQAIWLAETGVPLGQSLSSLLDLSGDSPGLEILPENRDGLAQRSALERARARSTRVLESIQDDLADTTWYDEGWLDRTLNSVLPSFDAACDRWRDLYRAASRQRDAQHRIITDASRSSDDKKKAKRLRREAESQLDILIAAENVFQADFYSYRYFASEGFLPGYNFPRLPLSAFIPGRRKKRGQDEFVSRPRFLAISEFGPRAILYHEGARYLINRVMLTSERQGDSEEIVTARAKLCTGCGYLHPHFVAGSDGPDLCERCRAALGAPMESLFRLQNVSTRRRDKISSDEEERLRLGYELKTGVRFERRAGRLSARSARLLRGDEKLAELTYGDAARLWRINLGWRRRAHRADIGFELDVERGYWARSQQEQDESEDPLSNRRRRVVPYVEDHRNCLLVQPAAPLDAATMATLQAALKHALLRLFQLEGMELAAEPLPSQDQRNQILLYESAEGGAGVLRRLVDDPSAFARLARAALSVCHFDPDTCEDLRRAPGAKEDCEAACYDCLMSYTNQPDHRLLDRQRVRDLLRDWARCRVDASPVEPPRGEHLAALRRACASALEKRWLDFLEEHELALPSHAQRRIDACNTRPDFFYEDTHVAIYVDGPHHEYPQRAARDREQTASMEYVGYSVIRFPKDADWMQIVRAHPSVFGEPVQRRRAETPQDEPAGFDPDLFPSVWHELLQQLAAEGVSIDPGGDVASAGGVVGSYIAALRRGNGALRLVDGRDARAQSVCEACDSSGNPALPIDPADAEAASKALRELAEQA